MKPTRVFLKSDRNDKRILYEKKRRERLTGRCAKIAEFLREIDPGVVAATQTEILSAALDKLRYLYNNQRSGRRRSGSRVRNNPLEGRILGFSFSSLFYT